MAELNDKIKGEVKDIVYHFFAEECEVDIETIDEKTDILEDLGGDSLMFLELIETFKKKYHLDIELKTIGKYSVKNPVRTIGELLEMQYKIIQFENAILNQ